MITVFTKIDKKLARFQVDTDNYAEAIELVRGSMKVRHRSPVLALLETPQEKELA
jgi:hypothetical protein